MGRARFPQNPRADDAPDPEEHSGASSGEQSPGPISARNVRYLSFKGGGGKGWAFLGALAAFTHEDIRIMTEGRDSWSINTAKIDGISGTSAGGLIGALAAVGMSLDSMFGMVLDERDQLRKFFDPPYGRNGSGKSLFPVATSGEHSIRRPTAGADGTTEEVDSWTELNEQNSEEVRAAGWYDVKSNREDLGIPLSSRWYTLWIDEEYECMKGIVDTLLTGQGDDNDDDGTPKTFEKNMEGHFQNLIRDGGVCSGVWAREYIAKKLSDVSVPSDTKFSDLPPGPKPKLCLVGSDITPGYERMVYFSRDGTPGFKLADAMRITMGFPALFKPVVVGPKPFVWHKASEFRFSSKRQLTTELSAEQIPYGGDSFDPRGIWVDGGVTNQLAAHAFDPSQERDSAGVPKVPVNAYGRNVESSPMNPRMLALNLDNTDPEPAAWGPKVLSGAITGLTEVAAAEREFRTLHEKANRLDIPYEPLSLFDFTPSRSKMATATVNAAQATFDYFGVTDDVVSHLLDVTPFNDRELPKPGGPTIHN